MRVGWFCVVTVGDGVLWCLDCAAGLLCVARVFVLHPGADAWDDSSTFAVQVTLL